MDIRGFFATRKMSSPSNKDKLEKVFPIYLYGIEKICGRKVSCSIELYGWKNQHLALIIKSSEFHTIDSSGDIELVEYARFYQPVEGDIDTAMKLLIDEFNKKVPTLEFHKLSGRILCPEKKEEYELAESLQKMIVRHENIIFKNIECCVCHEDTKCETNCGHVLCYECCDNIKPTPNEDDPNESSIKCPMCRDPVYY